MGGTNLGSDLAVGNDYGSHWLLEPSKEMLFEKYKSSLTALNATRIYEQQKEKPLNIELPILV